MTKPNITQNELRERVNYDPETGIFTWKIRKSNAVKVGEECGFLNCKGYRYISLDGKHYLAHRLAFLYMEGYFPENDVDHINRIKWDNRWCNLREVSRSCNMRNCNLLVTNTSGVTGVRFNKFNNRWVAKMRIFDRHLHLGYFDTKLDAAKARLAAEIEYGFKECKKESSAFLYIQKHEKKEGNIC